MKNLNLSLSLSLSPFVKLAPGLHSWSHDPGSQNTKLQQWNWCITYFKLVSTEVLEDEI